MSKGYNFVNRLTRLAHETGEKTDRTHENVYEEELSFVHEQKVKFLFVNNRKQIPLNWDPSEFKDKVSSIWGINLDFFDFPPVSFEEESISWKKIFRENIFQPFLPKSRIVLEHFVKNVQELNQLKTLQSLNNADEPNSMDTPRIQQITARKGSAFKYEYAEKAIAQMKSLKTAADKAAQISNYERRKRMYAFRANENLHKFFFKVNRLRNVEETQDLVSHKYYRIDLSLDTPPIENMLMPDEAPEETKKFKHSSFRRHFLTKPVVTTSREGHRSNKRTTIPIKPRRKSCECSICGGINEKEKRAYDLPNYQGFVRSTSKRPTMNVDNKARDGLESSKISEDSPLSPSQSPFGKQERGPDSKKNSRRFSWDLGAMFDGGNNPPRSRKGSAWHNKVAEPPKKSNYSKFSKMKSETDEQLLTEGDIPVSPISTKQGKRMVVSMTKLPFTLQKIKSIDEIFSAPPKNLNDAKSLPMIHTSKPLLTQTLVDTNIKPIKPKEGKVIKLKKKSTPKRVRRTYEKTLNNTLSKFMILNAYVPSSSTTRMSTSKDLKLFNHTSTISNETKTPTEIKSSHLNKKPNISLTVTKKMNEILNPRLSLPSHRIIHKSDALTDSTSMTVASPLTVTSPSPNKIKIKKIRIPSFHKTQIGN